VARRDDGKVVFIPMVLPGEKVRIRTDKEHTSYCTADVLRSLSDPRGGSSQCALFTRCGGCDWQHLPYEDQLSWKKTILESELTRAVPYAGTVHQDPSHRLIPIAIVAMQSFSAAILPA